LEQAKPPDSVHSVDGRVYVVRGLRFHVRGRSRRLCKAVFGCVLSVGFWLASGSVDVRCHLGRVLVGSKQAYRLTLSQGEVVGVVLHALRTCWCPKHLRLRRIAPVQKEGLRRSIICDDCSFQILQVSMSQVGFNLGSPLGAKRRVFKSRSLQILNKNASSHSFNEHTLLL